MDSNAVSEGIELVARGLEVLGVAVIGVAFVYGSIRGLLHIQQRNPDSYQRLKFYIGKALQLGLEFLVATFLSWSITVETEGRWPWQVGTDGKA